MPRRGCVVVGAQPESTGAEVVAQDADRVERAGHPEIDVAPCGGAERAAHCDVAAVAGGIAARRVPGGTGNLVVRDAVLQHVARMRFGLRRPGRIGGDRGDAGHRSIGVDHAQPVVVRNGADPIRTAETDCAGDQDQGGDRCCHERSTVPVAGPVRCSGDVPHAGVSVAFKRPLTILRRPCS